MEVGQLLNSIVNHGLLAVDDSCKQIINIYR